MPDPRTPAQERYSRARNALSKAVSAKIAGSKHEDNPRRIRAGLVMNAVLRTALIRLLVKKGVITMSEWDVVAADQTELAVRDLEVIMTRREGRAVVFLDDPTQPAEEEAAS